MATVQMPDGTMVEMPDTLDDATGKRMRAFLNSQTKAAPVEAIPEGEGDYRSRAESGSKARLRARQVNANAPGVSALETYGTTPGQPVEPAMSGPRLTAERAAAGLADIPMGAVQFLSNATGIGDETVNKFMSEREQAIEGARMQNARSQIAQLISTPEFQQIAKTDPGLAQSRINAILPGVDVSRLLSGMIIPGAAGAKVAKMTGPLVSQAGPVSQAFMRTGLGAAGGAATAAVTPEEVASREEYAATKKAALPVAAGIGAAIPVVGSAIRKATNPQMSRAVAELESRGVNVPLGASLGPLGKGVEDFAARFQIVGAPVRSAQARAAQQVRDAGVNEVLGEIGQALPRSLEGRDAIQFMQQAVSDAYENVLARIPPQRIDSELMLGLDGIAKSLKRFPPEVRRDFERRLEADLLDRLQNKSSLDGKGFKALEQNLGADARSLIKSDDADKQALGRAMNAAREQVREWLARKVPAEAAELSRVNRAFAKELVVNDAAARSTAIGGNWSPRDLRMAVSKQEGNKARVAAGQGRLQDLADAAQSTIREVPVSMLAQGGEVAGAVGTGGASLLPLVPMAALYSPTGQSLVKGAIYNRPQAVRTVGELVGSGVRDVGPMAAGNIERERRREKK